MSLIAPPVLPHFAATRLFHVAKVTENGNSDVLNPWFEFFQSEKRVILEMAHHLQCFHLKYFCNGSRLGNVLSVKVKQRFHPGDECVHESPKEPKHFPSFKSWTKQINSLSLMRYWSLWQVWSICQWHGCIIIQQYWYYPLTFQHVLYLCWEGLLSNVYSLFSTTVFIWHTWKGETQYSIISSPAAALTLNYSNICEGESCSGGQNNHSD